MKYMIKALTIIVTLLSKNATSRPLDMQKNINNLTNIQKYVTQHDGTERPFDNEYWDNKKEGIYVDIISGEPLFSSKDKFDSGTGWPSFSKPIKQREVVEKTDKSLGITRIEVRSKTANSHLGHIFNDGPAEKGGLRYCINSAALKFIPKDDLKKEGYEEFLYLFDDVVSKKDVQRAIVAGGCFWGMEELVRKLDGVIDIKAGYTGGSVEDPSYKLITTGLTGHAESIEVTFDANKTSYETILRFFFQIHDPTTLNKQGNDVGSQYRSAIFYLNEEQKEIAKKLIKKADASGVFPGKIVTQIAKATDFYDAEEYHQDYLQKNPGGYTCHKIRKEWVF